MGKFDGKFFHGAVGPSVFKEYRGMQVVQGKSRAKIKLTKETKKAANVFGTGSKLAACIRQTLVPVVANLYDGTMVYRFTADTVFAIRTALTPSKLKFNFSADSFSRLDGFEFNLDSPLKNLFFAQPAVNYSGETIEVNIPEMQIPRDLKFPELLRHCRMILSAGFFDLINGHYKRSEVEIFDVDYSYTPETVPSQQFTFEKQAGCLTVIGLCLQYYEKTFTGNIVVNNKKFNPSAILKAFIPEGAPDFGVTSAWSKMGFNV